MTKTPLIYKWGADMVLLDPEWERRIGVYDELPQAHRAWAAYIAQGRVGSGFDITVEDEKVLDLWRAEYAPTKRMH